MKRILVGLTFLNLMMQSYSQTVIFQQSIGDSVGSLNLELKTISNNILLLGSYPSCDGLFTFGCRPFIIYKYDTNANFLNSYKYTDDTAIYQSYNIAADSNSGFIITGGYFNSYNYIKGLFISNLDSNYNTIRGKLYAGIETIYGYHIFKNSNNLVVAGVYDTNGNYTEDLILIKTDTALNPLWSYRYGHAGDDGMLSAIPTSDLGFLINGVTSDSPFVAASVRGFVSKLDSAGNLMWNKTYKSKGTYIVSVIQLNSGNYLLSGQASDTIGAVGFLMEIDSIGNIVWDRKYRHNALGFGKLIRTTDGGFAAIGATYIGIDAPCLVKFDSAGNVQWANYYDNQGPASDVVQTADGGYLILNKANYSQTNLNIVIHLIKTDSVGNGGCYTVPFTMTTSTGFIVDTISFYRYPLNLTATDITLYRDTVPLYDSLWCSGYSALNETVHQQNNLLPYPNPATSEIIIPCPHCDKRNYMIEIYDIAGKRIQFNIMQISNGGISFSLEKIEPGYYFYKLNDGISIMSTGKFIVIK